MRTHLLVLAAPLIMAACADQPPSETVRGDYTLVGGSCEVTLEGEAPDTFSLTGGAFIEEPSSMSPDGCEAVISIEPTTCSSCAPPRCQLCLHDVTTSGATIEASLRPALMVEGLGSCSLEDYRGGLSMDLFFSGVDSNGELTLNETTGSLTVSFTSMGDGSIGISYEEMPATATCNLTVSRVEED